MEKVKTVSGYLFIDRHKKKFLRLTENHEHTTHLSLFYDWEPYGDIEEDHSCIVITKENGTRIISKKAD